MPYLNCPNCRLTVYTAATHAYGDECPRCHAELGTVARMFTSELPPRLESREREPERRPPRPTA